MIICVIRIRAKKIDREIVDFNFFDGIWSNNIINFSLAVGYIANRCIHQSNKQRRLMKKGCAPPPPSKANTQVDEFAVFDLYKQVLHAISV